jgi:glycosyltransferase involved in cell wall biosynthesis
MKILFVAMAESVHTSRWISQLNATGWDVHLFPSRGEDVISPELRNVRVHHTVYSVRNAHPSVTHSGIRLWTPIKKEWLGIELRRLVNEFLPEYRVNSLVRLIKRLKPDIVHSLEFQHAGYMTLEARKRLGDDYPFPPWIVSSWGNDIYLFGRLEAHRKPIRELLHYADYYISDCRRDIPLVIEHGFQGKVIGSILAGGGYYLDELPTLDQLTKPSERKIILVKGYQSFAGRALFALRALARCVDILKDYEIKVYFASNEIEIAVETLAQDTGLNISAFSQTSHDRWLELLASARVNIGISISDGTPLAMLESLLLGTFPVQSYTACADEWLCDGETGLLVPPEDVDAIAAAIRRAVTDDMLVDDAARQNYEVAHERLDYDKIRSQVVEMYQSIATTGSRRQKPDPENAQDS